VHQIESGLFHRQGKAKQLLKEPYCFDFISLEEKTTESNL